MSGSEAYASDAYWESRKKLIADERSLRRDVARIKNATADELKADEIIRAIRLEEEKSFWSIEHEGVPNTFPGMEFLTGNSQLS